MASAMGMGSRLFIGVLCVFLALDLPSFGDAARSRPRSRKGNRNRQSKRQQNSEISSDGSRTDPNQARNCIEPSKKVLRLRYDTMGRQAANATMVPGLVMLPAPGRSYAHGITSTTPSADTSTCPYTPVPNFDGNRWPRFIMEAACECDHCYLERRRPNDTCPTSTNSHLPEGYCRRITRQIAVLRRAGCEGDFARYNQDVVTVSVGCECVIGIRRSD